VPADQALKGCPVSAGEELVEELPVCRAALVAQQRRPAKAVENAIELARGHRSGLVEWVAPLIIAEMRAGAFKDLEKK
jgi:hypothetical protein